ADLPLLLAPGEQVSYFVTWPHVRPWRFFRVEPALRALPDGQRVAAILGAALKASDPNAAAPTNSKRAQATSHEPSLTAA
ncbi:MAG: hypothetical protein RL261_265, partial [Pseudomonadota bacterium]